MPHLAWSEYHFQNYNYEGIDSPGATSDPLAVFHSTARLVRTLLWWDLRVLVAEDHTFFPRAPYPFQFDVYAAADEEQFPPTGRPEDQVMTGLMCTVPTVSFGTILGTEEIQNRLWVGNSGPNPMDSKAQRAGSQGTGTWNMRIRIQAAGDTSSPDGVINLYPCLFFFRLLFLFQLDF